MMKYKMLSYERRMNVDLRSYSDTSREFFDELTNLIFIDALSWKLAAAVEQLRNVVHLSEDIIDSIFNIVITFTIR